MDHRQALIEFAANMRQEFQRRGVRVPNIEAMADHVRIIWVDDEGFRLHPAHYVGQSFFNTSWVHYIPQILGSSILIIKKTMHVDDKTHKVHQAFELYLKKAFR